jgi:iron complex transport system ATP-binding protein
MPTEAVEQSGDDEVWFDLQHVSVMRGQAEVLHDISLCIRKGEHIALLGPNGCGKSTLLKTLTCECYPLARPQTVCRIFGRDRWELTELRRHLGVLSASQASQHALQARGVDVVLSGFFASNGLWPNLEVTPQMRKRAAEILERLEAAHLAEKPLGEMSAGEQRRVLMGRALVHDPQVLLLDEPSEALDFAAGAASHPLRAGAPRHRNPADHPSSAGHSARD